MHDNEYIPTYPKERISVYDLITMYKNNIPLPQRVKLYLGSHQLIYKLYLGQSFCFNFLLSGLLLYLVFEFNIF